MRKRRAYIESIFVSGLTDYIMFEETIDKTTLADTCYHLHFINEIMFQAKNIIFQS